MLRLDLTDAGGGKPFTFGPRTVPRRWGRPVTPEGTPRGRRIPAPRPVSLGRRAGKQLLRAGKGLRHRGSSQVTARLCASAQRRPGRAPGGPGPVQHPATAAAGQRQQRGAPRPTRRRKGVPVRLVGSGVPGGWACGCGGRC